MAENKVSFWGGSLSSTLAVWDDEPGGTVVDRYEDNGIEYVKVEFKHSPGKQYLYLA